MTTMCLAIPGKLVERFNCEPPLMMALVEFGGVQRQISLACVPEAEVGDYILAHAGIAIYRIDEAEAERVLRTLKELGEIEEFGTEDARRAAEKDS